MLPAQAAGKRTERPELADLFRQCGESYRRAHPLPASHRKVMRALERCRTAELGGHLERCNQCGFERPAYNSCRNRHCPKCQSIAKARWLEKQKSELLPVGYFHLVFTLPHELNPLVLAQKRVLLKILFQAVSETLREFGRTHLKGTLAVTAVLHTWDQTLNGHFHLHCLVSAGALSFDQSRWVSVRKNFLFPVKALSWVFQGKFLDFLKRAFEQGKLTSSAAIGETIQGLYKKKWVVYAKAPFSGPEHLLDYLGRYTHRVALSNDRLLSVADGQVTFTYRDRQEDDRLKLMRLDAQEFIRRFLLHVLPEGFMRIRHFGFLANRTKKQSLARCRELLGLLASDPNRAPKSSHDLLRELTGVDLSRCPSCQRGTMVIVAKLSRLPREDSS